jgi:hypothetical protein
LEAFNDQFSSYNFEASYTAIYSDFLVTAYQVCPPAPTHGFCPEKPANVGRLLNLDYVPNRFFDRELGKYFHDFPEPATGKMTEGKL